MRGSCMTRQARRGLTSLPPLWWPMGQLRRRTQSELLYDGSTTLAVAPAVDRRRLFFVLISAVVGQSLCGEGRVIRPHYYQLTPQQLLLNFGL